MFCKKGLQSQAIGGIVKSWPQVNLDQVIFFYIASNFDVQMMA